MLCKWNLCLGLSGSSVWEQNTRHAKICATLRLRLRLRVISQSIAEKCRGVRFCFAKSTAICFAKESFVRADRCGAQAAVAAPTKVAFYSKIMFVCGRIREPLRSLFVGFRSEAGDDYRCDSAFLYAFDFEIQSFEIDFGSFVFGWNIAELTD